MDFLDLLASNGVGYIREGNKHCTAGWVQFDCPFCGDSGNFHMGYNLARGNLNCWSCGGHSMRETVALIAGISTHEAKTVVSKLEAPEVGDSALLRIREKYKPPRGVGPMKRAHKDYLRSRGLDSASISKLYGVQGIGYTARFTHRLFIPITLRGIPMSWTTRSILKTCDQRYISASAEEEAMNHKELLYGEEHAGMSGLFVEGPTDVWNVGPGAMGTFGTAFLEAQVARMSRFFYRTICFDGEKKAQRLAHKLMELLSVFPGETQNIVLDADDPGCAKPKEVRALRRAARLD